MKAPYLDGTLVYWMAAAARLVFQNACVPFTKSIVIYTYRFGSAAVSPTPSGSPFATLTFMRHTGFGKSHPASKFGPPTWGITRPQESTPRLNPFTIPASVMFSSPTVPTIKIESSPMPASGPSCSGAATPRTPTSSSHLITTYCGDFPASQHVEDSNFSGSIAGNNSTSNSIFSQNPVSGGIFGGSNVHVNPLAPVLSSNSASLSEWQMLSVCRADEAGRAFQSLPREQ